ncbi:MAG: FG-GAP repeat protein [Phycisphaerales bacterium]|nr:MAG: FG-GAP repeat protein [Phycisphaerales bacterium]
MYFYWYDGPIAIQDDVIALSVWWDSELIQGAGSVDVYRHDGADWFLEENVTADEPGANDIFGCGLAMSSDFILAGAPGSGGSNHRGQVHAFRRIGDEWVEQQLITPSDSHYGDGFGCAISMDEGLALIGAGGADEDRGAVYLYKYDGEAWVEQHRLTAVDRQENDWFGIEIALDGDVAAVGVSRGRDVDGVMTGCVYVFQYDDQTARWYHRPKLFAFDAAEADRFGRSVSVSGNRLLLGAYGDDNEQGADAGAAYFYDITEHQVNDCNNNYVADDCDVAYGVSEDCNDDGVPDECLDTPADSHIESGPLSPIGYNSPQSFAISGLSEVLEDVSLIFTAYADLSAPSEWIDVDINGVWVGNVFVENGDDCADPPVTDELIVPMDLFNSLFSDGQDVVITMTATDSVNAGACGGESYINVTFDCYASWSGLLYPLDRDSGELSPIGKNSPQSYTITNAPRAMEDVSLTFTAYADLSATYEWIDVDINGAWIARLFEEDSDDCANPPDEAQVIVSATMFNSLLEDGPHVVITMTASDDVSSTACGGDSYIGVSVNYHGLWLLDQNNNGIPDDCECLGDVDDNGKVNIDDLFRVLGKWGTCDDCPEDVNVDGKVNIDDVFIILGSWGPCE